MNLSVVIAALLSTFIVSLISLVGIITLSLKREQLDKILLFLISISTGALLGDVFIHLLPEAAYEQGGFDRFLSFLVMGGVLCFFVLEKFILWHHHHAIETPNEHQHERHSHEDCSLKSLRLMNLIGDGIHNFIDGMVIAASFFVNPVIGVSTTLAVMLHEIPQEIGDFGVLIHTGLSVKKATVYNFASALAAILGAILVLVIGHEITAFNKALIPFTAGGFLYIATSDLIPELKKSAESKASLKQFFFILLGIGLMWALLFLDSL